MMSDQTSEIVQSEPRAGSCTICWRRTLPAEEGFASGLGLARRAMLETDGPMEERSVSGGKLARTSVDSDSADWYTRVTTRLSELLSCRGGQGRRRVSVFSARSKAQDGAP